MTALGKYREELRAHPRVVSADVKRGELHVRVQGEDLTVLKTKAELDGFLRRLSK